MRGNRVLKKQKEQLNKSLLGTYFVSLFSVLLSFVMLLGTTFAWFYTDNTSLGNEIRSGSLKVDMLHVTEGGNKRISLAERGDNYSVFFSDDLWTPDDCTRTATVEIVNTGDVVLDYKLDFVPVPNKLSSAKAAELFTVYVNGEKVGSLDQFLTDLDDKTDDFLLGSGQGLDSGAVRSIKIELQMDTTRASGFMGQRVPVYLKLEAYQHLDGMSW